MIIEKKLINLKFNVCNVCIGFVWFLYGVVFNCDNLEFNLKEKLYVYKIKWIIIFIKILMKRIFLYFWYW